MTRHEYKPEQQQQKDQWEGELDERPLPTQLPVDPVEDDELPF